MSKHNAYSCGVNLRNPVIQLSILRKLTREWMYCMTGAEFKVLVFIYDRTIGWGKSQEYITLSQFTDGIDDYTEGTGLSRRAVQVAIKNLKDAGAIEVIRGNDGQYFSINTEWIPGE